ncbi:MAG: serine protease [candidate division Zixibacteria bacterium]|nr:serine protease [candidate division Zixibacteria bacterium]
MKRTLKKWLPLTTFLVIILGNYAFTQSLPIGRILLTPEDTTSIGTAFVAGNSKSIYTCSHVALKDTLWFQYIGSAYNFRIALKYNLPRYDISFFQRTGGSQPNALEFGDFQRIYPGDTIQYIGYDSRVREYVLWKAPVSAKGSAIIEGGSRVEFIEFQGEAIPGYSGGPVLDASGKVVAILREAWSKTPIKGGPPIRTNRAFSTELLRVLDSEVKLSH